MRFLANLERDASRNPLPGGLPFVQRKNRAYTGAAALGAVGATTLFTVTGAVLVRVLGYCSEDLAGATATIEVGIAGNTPGLIALTTATDIDTGESWIDATPSTLEAVSLDSGVIIASGQDIIETIATANITDGTLDFACFWRPISSDGFVVAT